MKLVRVRVRVSPMLYIHTCTCGTEQMPIFSQSVLLLSKHTSAKVTSWPSMSPNSVAVCLNCFSIALEAPHRTAWNFTTTRDLGSAEARRFVRSASLFTAFGGGGGELGRNFRLSQTHCSCAAAAVAVRHSSKKIAVAGGRKIMKREKGECHPKKYHKKTPAHESGGIALQSYARQTKNSGLAFPPPKIVRKKG